MGIFMIKKLLAIIVLVMVTSLSIAGCTTTNNTTQTSSATPTAAAQHDALLEKFVNAMKQDVYGNASNKIQAWDVTWNNGTSVTILETAKESSAGFNTTISGNSTMMSFRTTQDATNYLNAFDKTNYSLTSTDYANDSTSHIYYNATGYYPSVYKEYSYTEGSILSGSAKLHYLTQYDNIIQMLTATVSF
jgi:outer membrane murein-binding lipoprotein Lpp